ncbi:MAG: methyl-accepting chemotaxis protein [Candidatus Sedimenticola sp. (ex Thyasira tokunagai)]
MKLAHKLLAAFLAVSVIPLLVTGIMTDIKATRALSLQSFDQLATVRSIKGGQISEYFADLDMEAQTLAQTMGLLYKEVAGRLEALQINKQEELKRTLHGLEQEVMLFAGMADVEALYHSLEEHHEQTGGVEDGPYDTDSSEYRALYKEYGEKVAREAESLEFEDILLICAADGHVMFSSARRDDMGSNLRFGPYRESVLHQLWKKVVEGRKLAMVDFAPYAANGGKPTAYIGAPLLVSGRMRGVVAVQVPLDRINQLMSDRNGLGESGESYLVGPDLLMRSDSSLDPVHRSVEASFANPTKGRVDTEAVRAALKGERGHDIITDYRGVRVISTWAPISLFGINWAFLTEMDIAEAFNPNDEDGKEFLQQYQERDNLYDTFVIDSSGYVFYTAAKEADYQTNILTGPYHTSNLGRLTAKVMETGVGGFTDLEPYAPSNNQPSAFVAYPVMDGGKVRMVVAIQADNGEINKIMHHHEGVSETGDTFLVGPDKRMRSDSHQDHQGHSIAASFAGTVEHNGVDTVASREALAGRTDTRIISNVMGKRVLSSYAPLKVGNFTWAVIAEIEEREAFAAVDELQWMIVLIGLLAMMIIVAAAIWLARSITNPITMAVNLSSAIADGRLDQQIESDSEDEVGHLIDSMGTMSTRLSQIVAEVRMATDNVVIAAGEISRGNMDLSQRTEEQASSLEETASSMEELTSTVRQNADSAGQANQLASGARQQAEEGGDVARQAVEAMSDINDSSKRIADIISVIDEIAFQTNLLSLNAAVEAARAGEHGRGFAVVADEVRRLAQRSADAAKEIKELITDSVEKVEHGRQLVDASGKALTDIISSVKQVCDIVAEITAASREQSVGIEQVNTAIVQMDEVTQQNASLVEEAAAAASALEEQAQQLQRTMAFFQVDEEEENKRVFDFVMQNGTSKSPFCTQSSTAY